MINLVVAKKKDGTLVKGSTGDFHPDKLAFYINTRSGTHEETIKLKVDDLKAIFFVNKLEGDKNLHDSTEKEVTEAKPLGGKYVNVTFLDGEAIEGFTHSFHLERYGFFMTPKDASSNNKRIFVVLSSVEKLNVDGRNIKLSDITKEQLSCRVCKNAMDENWKYCPFDGTKIQI